MPTNLNIVIILIAINIITFVAYGLDKYYARNSLWRIPEGILLLLTLCGGGIAGFAARRFFRHKTKKLSFVIKFWIMIIIQVIVIAYYFLIFHA